VADDTDNALWIFCDVNKVGNTNPYFVCVRTAAVLIFVFLMFLLWAVRGHIPWFIKQ
jgi:hypothetical protein